MPQIESSRFGSLHYEEDNIISFPKGLPGFYTFTRWVFAGEEESPVKWLQSLDDMDVALPIVHPQVFFPEYHAQIPREELEDLGEAPEENITLLLVLTIPRNAIWEMTANLRAPLVVHGLTRKARQVLLDSDDFSMHSYCFSQSQRDFFAEKYKEEATEEAQESCPKGREV